MANTLAFAHIEFGYGARTIAFDIFSANLGQYTTAKGSSRCAGRSSFRGSERPGRVTNVGGGPLCDWMANAVANALRMVAYDARTVALGVGSAKVGLYTKAYGLETMRRSIRLVGRSSLHRRESFYSMSSLYDRSC